MIRFSYTKRLNEVKTDRLNTEGVYGLCLLEKIILVYYLWEFQNYLEEVWYFCYFSCGDIELCPGPYVPENLTDISKLSGIKLVHQNIRALVSKKDILETLFTNKKDFNKNLNEVLTM